ncbi:hypothetical protein CANTEDRAFT_116012 [Yamadazyma tenuis ATCC 10573]|uniref:Uncharacterized protein n=1 Tax=Candida tenuis (strain ATCC 10573 / BCRC 21748 / CBS 615 / JCM 9827 / NBRC 10315 / NRRL Y-1498 / VKM Y-70) TaxID=590646 RepID=G3BF14_CANTC|nr:uncharacterized protein CANTEDRAFT_116012 [Yamadazyma tenuis ATCC 10573]EGV59985.1 hypothetical protein CANTEDRAFT_116012 [Yamadazyma tenuis ATCC 10573]
MLESQEFEFLGFWEPISKTQTVDHFHSLCFIRSCGFLVEKVQNSKDSSNLNLTQNH